MQPSSQAEIALIIEEVAPGERIGRINQRVSRFLHGGVAKVWLVLPHEGAVIAFGNHGEINVIEAGDELPEADRPAELWLRAESLLRPVVNSEIGNGP